MDTSDYIVERRMLSLSTAHVSPEGRDWLNEQSDMVTGLQKDPNKPYPKIHIFPFVYGWMFFADIETDHPSWPAEVKALAIKAREMKCDWVELDCDSSIMEGLPTWDW